MTDLLQLTSNFLQERCLFVARLVLLETALFLFLSSMGIFLIFVSFGASWMKFLAESPSSVRTFRHLMLIGFRLLVLVLVVYISMTAWSDITFFIQKCHTN